MSLIATRPVLYRSSQYRKGDALPADNQAMVQAWLDAGSAKWEEDAQEAPAPAAPAEPEAEKPKKKPAAKAKKEAKK